MLEDKLGSRKRDKICLRNMDWWGEKYDYLKDLSQNAFYNKTPEELKMRQHFKMAIISNKKFFDSFQIN